MRLLKILRLLSVGAALTCLLVEFMPEILHGEYDTWTMVVLLAFFVLVPVFVSGSIRREKQPKLLAEYNKGYLVFNIVLFAAILVFAAWAMATDLMKGGSPWLYSSFALVGLYQMCNTIILYNARKRFEEDNEL